MMAENQRICSVEGCGKKPHGYGFCSSHLKRFQRHGAPQAGFTAMRAKPDWIEANKAHQGDDCLVWPFPRGERGYGSLKVAGTFMFASRAMCFAAHGNPPTSKHQAAHRCGMGHEGCVNPKHLRWATPAENSAETVVHGTSGRGSRNGMSALTEDQVRQVRQLFGQISGKDIAERFGVSPSAISLIRKRKNWGWLDDGLHPRDTSSIRLESPQDR